MAQTYLRGDLCYADLSGSIGSEQKGYRPVLIIQNNKGNTHSPTVIVAAISSKVEEKPGLPIHYPIRAISGNRLTLPSVVLLEQIRTLDKQRLGNYIGRLPYAQLQGVDQALEVSLGLKKNTGRRESP